MDYRGWKVIEVWNGHKWTRNGGLFRGRSIPLAIALDLEYLRGIPARVRVIR